MKVPFTEKPVGRIPCLPTVVYGIVDFTLLGRSMVHCTVFSISNDGTVVLSIVCISF